MLETFSGSILCSENGKDDLLVQHIVGLLMDHHQEIMTIPIELKQQITERINRLHKVCNHSQVYHPFEQAFPTYLFLLNLNT